MPPPHIAFLTCQACDAHLTHCPQGMIRRAMGSTRRLLVAVGKSLPLVGNQVVDWAQNGGADVSMGVKPFRFGPNTRPADLGFLNVLMSPRELFGKSVPGLWCLWLNVLKPVCSVLEAERPRGLFAPRGLAKMKLGLGHRPLAGRLKRGAPGSRALQFMCLDSRNQATLPSKAQAVGCWCPTSPLLPTAFIQQTILA